MSGFVTPVASWGRRVFFSPTSIFTSIGLILTKLIGVEWEVGQGMGQEANWNTSLASHFRLTHVHRAQDSYVCDDAWHCLHTVGYNQNPSSILNAKTATY